MVEFPDATGVYEANMIMFNGVPIGRISKIAYRNGHPDMPVLIRMAIDKEVEVPDDSRFEIQTLDLLGKRAIAFLPGRSKKMADEEVLLKGNIKEDILASVARELTPVTQKASALMSSIDTLVKDVHRALGPDETKAISSALKTAQSAVENLNSITVKVNDILSSQQGNLEGSLANVKKLTDNLAGNTEKLDNILTNIDKFSGEVAQIELKSVVESAKKTLTEINSLLTKVSSGEGTIGKLVADDSLYNGINDAISSLNTLLIDVKANPKRYVSLSLIERKDKTPKAPAPLP